MLSFFFFLFFRCLVRCLLPFFVVRLFLGSFCGKIFGSELCFWVAVVVAHVLATGSGSPKGEMLSVFFFSCFLCLVRCLLLFFCRSSVLRAAFWKNFRERTFVFGWSCWSCVFWWVFAIVFALFFGVLLPKLFGKILLMSGLVFSGFVLSSLGFFVVVVVFFFF